MNSTITGSPPSGSIQPDILAALAITLSLAVIAVTLRFAARRLVKMPIGLDDWLTIISLFLTLGFDVNIFILVRNGVGVHIDTINRDPVQIYHDFFLGLWIAELFYTFALAPAKLALLALYWRIFQIPSIRMPIKTMVAAVACWSVARTIVIICHCIPVQGYWDKTISANCNVDDQKFFVGTVTLHLIMDLIILALPVPYIKSLQISLYQKICILAMFLLGGFICFATIIQIVTCFKLDVTSPDVTWTFAPIGLWASVEVNLAVMAICLPSLRPIYRLVVKGTLKSTQQQSGYQWNERTNPRTLDTFKTTYSDSTRQLAAVDGDGNRSFNEALDSSRSTDTTCEMDNMNPSRMHDSTKGIMVKNEVHVKTSSKAAQV